ncbi:bifunctional 2-polyprenyl-6-hydroxyphenol methylase/3-demethylubiquinol 3-O-methyltransferase UbiG [Streptomyces sp. NBC_00094]|uniref:class I SAM-dependent methyltransferase n=1 Tax=Streptomyces sp. NBC_00094 TaxID=2903620 RepID=UPI0022557365|nr:class I SAM-dependent methyltransferase [Streptomyces sp. NBC_00094]MCX5394454.1 class I SAM-dependent methyltransferase [Streptomyces sp. NBC_00094]
MREHGAEQRALSAAELFDDLGLGYERAFGHLPEQLAAIDWLTGRLGAGARVLDVGSGTGRPVADRLTRAGFAVTGIDVSRTMVELARSQVPGARFEQCGVHDFDAPEGGFDAVCAFFPLLVMGRDEVSAALRRMAGWLAPGGYLVTATVPADVEDVEIEWMGRRVRVSSFSAEEYVRQIREECGLDVLHHAVSVFQPDDEQAGPEDHVFCYARRAKELPGG